MLNTKEGAQCCRCEQEHEPVPPLQSAKCTFKTKFVPQSRHCRAGIAIAWTCLRTAQLQGVLRTRGRTCQVAVVTA
jgi:hypothetical protein